jgi:hypothetical protein
VDAEGEVSDKQGRLTGIIIIGMAVVFLLAISSKLSDSLSALDLFPIKSKGSQFNNLRFSADGHWLAFDLCEDKLFGKKCQNVIYDISNDRYLAWRDAKSRPINHVSFSADGTQALFTVETSTTFLGFGKHENRVAIADLSKARYRFITPGPGIKRHAEFWKDGSVIYVGTEPGDTGKRKSKYLYVVEPGKLPRKLIETGFYAPSKARPHWDGEQILMSEFNFTEVAHNKPLSDSGDEILSIKPAAVSIVVINIQPTPDYHTSFSGPAIARVAKKIYVKTLLKKESKLAKRYLYDIFVLDEIVPLQISRLDDKLIKRRAQDIDVSVLEGNLAQRVSWLSSYIYGMDVTDDGRLLAVVTADTSERSLRDFRLLLYDPQTRTSRELKPTKVQEQTFQSQDEEERSWFTQ